MPASRSPFVARSETKGEAHGGVEAIRVLVGPWARLRADPAAAQLERGPQTSGVFAEFARPARSTVPLPRISGQRNSGRYELRGLGEDGAVVRRFGPGAGLVAATRRFEAPPVWLVTGATQRGVRAAAGLLDAADLRDHYAVATEDGRGDAAAGERAGGVDGPGGRMR